MTLFDRSLSSARSSRGPALIRLALLCGAIATVPCTVSVRVYAEDDEKEIASIVERLRSSDDAIRMAAREEAPGHGAALVRPLADLIEGDDREASITARHALTALVHHAGRAGAEKERGPVLHELALLTRSDRSAFVRREAVWLIGHIGGDAEADLLASLLSDPGPAIAETARLALERLPGEAAARALRAAIEKASVEERPDLVFSLGKKRDSESVPFLLSLAESDDEAVRLACFQALSRSGAAEAIEPLEKAIEGSRDILQAKLTDEYLRLAEERLASGDDAHWRAMHRRSLASAPLEHQRERSLLRLCKPGNLSAVPDLLVGLDDASPRVRNTALGLLRDLRGIIALRGLRDGYERAAPAVRPLILEAMAEIDRDATEDLIEGALRSSDPDLRIAAVALAGKVDPSLESEYIARARSDESLVRGLAHRAYLTLAQKKLDEGDGDAAFSMYSAGFDAAREASERADALRGLIRVGDPRALDRVQGVLADPALGAEAAKGYISLSRALIAAGDEEGAATRLETLIGGRFPLEVVLEAAKTLREIGRDPRQGALDKGFVLDWWLVGPIRDDDGSGMRTKYFPEERIQFEEIERIGARRYRWKRLERLSLDGRIDLTVEFRRSQNVIAYAYTEIEVPEARDAVLRIGSDDGVIAWLDGTKVHEAIGPRSYAVDQDSVAVHLEKGTNKVLLKIGQGGGDWAFSLRITDPAGQPLALGK